MDTNKDADRRVTQSQTRDLPQPLSLAAGNSSGLTSTVAVTADQGNPVAMSAADETQKAEVLDIGQGASPGSGLLTARQNGSDGQSANSGFILSVEQCNNRTAPIKAVTIDVFPPFSCPNRQDTPGTDHIPKFMSETSRTGA